MIEINKNLEEVDHICNDFLVNFNDLLGYKFFFSGDFTFGEAKLLIDLIKDMDKKGHVKWPIGKLIPYLSENPILAHEDIEEWAYRFISQFISKTVCNAEPSKKKRTINWHGFQLFEFFVIGISDDGELMVDFKFSNFVIEPLVKSSN